jgi:UPF0271 protein
MLGATTLARAKNSGLRIATLGFLDRGYGPEGRIVPRQHPEALLRSASAVEARVTEIVRDGTLRAVDGSVLPAEVDMVLVHCDTPGAGEMAGAVVRSLAKLDVDIRPLAGAK